MKKLLLLLGIIFCGNLLSSAQIKRQYINKQKSDRTEVVKENDGNDLQILAENFSDAKLGAVIRISTEKPKTPKPPKTIKVKEKKTALEKPKVESPSVKPNKKSKPTFKKSKRKSTKKRKRRKIYLKKKKRKRVAKRKKYSCFQF